MKSSRKRLGNVRIKAKREGLTVRGYISKMMSKKYRGTKLEKEAKFHLYLLNRRRQA